MRGSQGGCAPRRKRAWKRRVRRPWPEVSGYRSAVGLETDRLVGLAFIPIDLTLLQDRLVSSPLYKGHETEKRAPLLPLDILPHNRQRPRREQVLVRPENVSPIYRSRPVAVQLVQPPIPVRLDEADVVVVDVVLWVFWGCRGAVASYLAVGFFEVVRGFEDARALLGR